MLFQAGATACGERHKQDCGKELLQLVENKRDIPSDIPPYYVFDIL